MTVYVHPTMKPFLSEFNPVQHRYWAEGQTGFHTQGLLYELTSLTHSH